MSERSVAQNWWQQIRQFPWLSVGWLTIGAAVLATCFVLWLSSQLAERLTVEVAPSTAAQTGDEATGLPDRLEGDIGMLFDAVPALDLSREVAVVGQRAAEFRGTEFIKANASHWTLQVMKVSQESVVKTYLLQRKDKQRFQYFRVLDGAQEYYLLTYGNFTTVQTAMGALQTMQFDLPNSVKAFPERFSTYQASVKDQGTEERMSGMAQKVRQILLNPIATPIEVEPAVRAASAARAARDERASVREPVFGALAGDQVATTTSPASNLAGNSASNSATNPAPSAADSTRRASTTEPSTPASVTPLIPVYPATSPSVNPTAVQDPFN